MNSIRRDVRRVMESGGVTINVDMLFDLAGDI